MTPSRISRKLLQRIFPSTFCLELPHLSMELSDSDIEVPIMNTNLEKRAGGKWSREIISHVQQQMLTLSNGVAHIGPTDMCVP